MVLIKRAGSAEFHYSKNFMQVRQKARIFGLNYGNALSSVVSNYTVYSFPSNFPVSI